MAVRKVVFWVGLMVVRWVLQVVDLMDVRLGDQKAHGMVAR